MSGATHCTVHDLVVLSHSTVVRSHDADDCPRFDEAECWGRMRFLRSQCGHFCSTILDQHQNLVSY